jgi:hypothetical protein
VAAAVLICALPWTANYLKDDADFLVKRAADPYYLVQKPFEDSKTDSENLNGNTIYYSEKGEVNSYYHCPSTCYKFMLDRTELIGDTIRQGFKAK